ncbi:hypothetical protein HYC85_017763 [Camellia sinensis]|uniref:Terpene synthase metal-binding domain-containing protein n=1 Tax=Camellia sinensis TaxID=4442 RepID=A0A7J7GVY8_CAMSI|nr:hypothetical protein HYC85_017763 [Camellia sinensis]
MACFLDDHVKVVSPIKKVNPVMASEKRLGQRRNQRGLVSGATQAQLSQRLRSTAARSAALVNGDSDDAELERGDAPSSILCFMREANVSEEIAREHIRTTIKDTWDKINHEFITQSPSLQPFVKYTINTARVAHFIYQHGDGFSNQDRETRAQVLSMLIEPLKLN